MLLIIVNFVIKFEYILFEMIIAFF